MNASLRRQAFGGDLAWLDYGVAGPRDLLFHFDDNFIEPLVAARFRS